MQTEMRNTPRYQSVDDTLPMTLPSITRVEATRAARLICKKFGKRSLGPVTMKYDVQAYRTRVCWLSPKPTSGSDHHKGWGRLIHDMSHHIFSSRHPSFRSHDGGHVTLEREIAAYVVAQGWLDGKLKPKEKPKLSTDEKRATALQRIDASLARWSSKEKRARNALRKLNRQRTALVRRMAH